MSSISNSRLTQETADQKMATGTQQLLSKLTSLTVGSQNVAPADIVKVFQDRIATSQAVQTATAARSAAVKADRDKRAQTAPMVRAFKRMVQGMYSESPDTLAVFGLAPLRFGSKTVATKAGAVEKIAATRKARHTMGSKQKLSVTGTSPSAITGSAALPATPPAAIAPVTSPAAIAPVLPPVATAPVTVQTPIAPAAPALAKTTP